ncbi:hypothetical protein JCM19992_01780 [Thermostilla marina]
MGSTISNGRTVDESRRWFRIDLEKITDLQKQAKELRREWNAFAAKVDSAFKAFKEQGSPLPADFWQRYTSLDEKRRRLIAAMRAAVSELPPEPWKFEDDEASLDTIDAALESLKTKIRESHATLRSHFLDLVDRLREVSRLDTDLSNGDEMLARPKADLVWLDELVERNDYESLFSDEATRKIASLESLSGLIRASADPADDAHTSATGTTDFDTLQQLFEQVADAYSLRTALACSRGRVWLRNDENAGAEHGRATVEQIQALSAKFSKPLSASATIASSAPKPKPSAPSDASTGADRPPVDTAKLRELAKRVRIRSEEIDGEAAAMRNGNGEPGSIETAVYENLARCCELVAEIFERRGDDRTALREELVQGLHLLAEAQNAVRVFGEMSDTEKPIPEQEPIFKWLRNVVSEDVEAVRIDRYMRWEDRADPYAFKDLATRIHGLEQQLAKAQRAKELLDEIADVSRQWTEQSDPHVWKTLNRKVEEFVRCGRKTSDPQLRDALLPEAEALLGPRPEECEPSPELNEALRFLEESLRQSEEEDDFDSDEGRESPEVAQAASWLRGKKMVVVGGIGKPEASKRLQEAFELAALDWVPSSSGDRRSDLRNSVRGADLVVLITKIIGHGQAEEIRNACKEYDIPYVQTKVNAGYGVNQIAACIVEQASDRLSHRAAPNEPDA